jgi:folate-dependent phosphoribosylglycinamide formyltransferase PurN
VRTLLICHHDSRLDLEFLPRWLASFSDLAGVVVVRDERRQLWRRARREMRRSGLLGLADAAAFRLFYRLVLAGDNARREEALVATLARQLPPLRQEAPTLQTASPNSLATAAFIRDAKPDIVLARCKHLLRRELFSIANTGTFAMHPGICPQYRNAHGCFWALANGDRENVGMTLLKIDEGVDTGPIYGFFKRPVESGEPHTSVQNRVVFENLDAIRDTLLRIHGGEAVPLAVGNRPSALWGQPRLSAYLRGRRAA